MSYERVCQEPAGTARLDDGRRRQGQWTEPALPQRGPGKEGQREPATTLRAAAATTTATTTTTLRAAPAMDAHALLEGTDAERLDALLDRLATAVDGGEVKVRAPALCVTH